MASCWQTTLALHLCVFGHVLTWNPAFFDIALLRQLFKRMLDQFDRLRKRNAFLEQYKKEKMFEHGLEEFDEARYRL